MRPMDAVLLKDQIAVVTGGGRGIGRAIAEALAHQGAAVAVLARSAHELDETVALIHASGGRAEAFPADVADPASVKRAFQAGEQSLGPVDLLINNAGALGPLRPLSETSAEDWWRTMEVNLRGPLLTTAAAIPGMMARRRGRIVNVSSGGGTFPTPNFSSYGVSKTALIRFTECVAIELKPFGIAAFSISPGTVRTAMSEISLNSPDGKKWIPWFARIFEEGLNLPPERAAQLVVTLASGKADALSGRFIAPADDLDAMIASAAEIEQNNLYSLRLRKLGVETPNPILRFAEKIPQ